MSADNIPGFQKRTRGPDFLCIGAHKSGTTWLYHQLQYHPELWLPPVKELHYFDRSPHYPSPSILGEESFVRRCKNKRWWDAACAEFKSALEAGDREHIAWMARWLFSDYSDSWYESLFEWAGERVAGEITPAYSILEEEEIESLGALNPDLKIIIILRNLIDRHWSHVCADVQYGITSTDLRDVDDIIEACRQPGVVVRSQYESTINRYLKLLGQGKILVTYFDAIATRPQELLSAVAEFVGVQNRDFEFVHRTRVYNKTETAVLPDAVRQHLNETFVEQARLLSERLGGYCAKWYADIVGVSFDTPDSELPVATIL